MFSWTHGRIVTQMIMGTAFSLTVSAGSLAASNAAIQWMDSTLEAYKLALAESKPLVLVFVHRNESWSVRFEREVMPSPELAALAGRAIFVRAAFETGPAAKAILEALEIKEIPTISVLAPNPDKIVETWRGEGFFPANELTSHLSKALDDARKAPGKFSRDRQPSTGAFQRLQDALKRIQKIPDRPSNRGNAAEKAVITGTAFLVSHEGYMLTNNHVIAGCKSITVRFDDFFIKERVKPFLGNAQQIVRVVKTDPQNDLALVIPESIEKHCAEKIKAGVKPWDAEYHKDSFFSFVPDFREDTHPIALGESVTVVGFPLRGLLTEINVTTGIVSSLAGLGGDKRFIQITAPVQAGNSGGPLLDARGNVMGVIVAKLDAVEIFKLSGDTPQNVNFAIRGELAREFLRSSISFSAFSPTQKKDTSVIAASAQSFTFPLECQK